MQRRFTKSLPGMTGISYTDRLKIVGMKSLEERRIFSDLILFYKVVNNLVDLDFGQFLSFTNSAITRGHKFKVNVQYCRTNVRKFFWSNRTAKIWNSLPERVVDITPLSAFKNALLSVDLVKYCMGGD